MAIHSFGPREFRPPRKWGGKPIKTVVCQHCAHGVLCRHVLRIGYLEVQCPQCGGILVIKSGDIRSSKPQPHVHGVDGRPTRAD